MARPAVRCDANADDGFCRLSDTGTNAFPRRKEFHYRRFPERFLGGSSLVVFQQPAKRLVADDLTMRQSRQNL